MKIERERYGTGGFSGFLALVAAQHLRPSFPGDRVELGGEAMVRMDLAIRVVPLRLNERKPGPDPCRLQRSVKGSCLLLPLYSPADLLSRDRFSTPSHTAVGVWSCAAEARPHD